MKTISTILLLLPAILCFSQKEGKDQTHPWYFNHIVSLSDSTGVAGLMFRDKKSGVAFLDNNGNVSTELSLSGPVIGVAKWKNNIVAVYSDQWDTWHAIKEVHAVLIDGKTKTILSDQLLYSNPGKNAIICSLNSDDKGNFGHLLIRTTGQPGNYDLNSEKDLRRLEATTAATAIYFSDAFQPLLKPLPSAAVGTDYLSSYANSKGEIAILSYSNGQVVAEKFGRDGQLQKKITAALPDYTPMFRDQDDGLRGLFNPISPDVLTLSLANPDPGRKHRNLSSFVFDFSNGKASVLESAKLDKDYYNQLKTDPALDKTKHFKGVEDLRADGIIYLGDTLALVNEIRYYEIGSPNIRYFSEGTIMSLYDRQYHLLHRFFLDRFYEKISEGGRGWTYHVRNGKIMAVCNEISGAEHYDNICYVIDPRTYTMDRKVLDWGSVPRMAMPNMQTVFWFRNSLLKNSWAGGSLLSSHFNTSLTKIDLP